MNTKEKIPYWDSPSKRQRRKRIEAELAAIPPLTLAQRKLMSTEGFVYYYFQMHDAYSSQREAYERLEDFYITLTGRRRYSEFNSFRKVIGRLVEKEKKRK